MQADLGSVRTGMVSLQSGAAGVNDEMTNLKKDLVEWLKANRAAGRRSV